MTSSPPRARRVQTRPPISIALVGLVTLLTAATGATLGALAWREKLAGPRALVDNAMAQAARMTADHAAAFLRHAETTVRLGPSLVARGLLAPGDSRALGEYALAVLRAYPQLSGVSYGDRDDRFVGAWHDGAGLLYLNRSFPRGGGIRLEEDRVLADGRRERVRESDDHRYRPREQAFFRLAETRRDVAWTEPYRTARPARPRPAGPECSRMAAAALRANPAGAGAIADRVAGLASREGTDEGTSSVGPARVGRAVDPAGGRLASARRGRRRQAGEAARAADS